MPSSGQNVEGYEELQSDGAIMQSRDKNPRSPERKAGSIWWYYMTWKLSRSAGCKNLEAFILHLCSAYSASKYQCGSKISMNWSATS